jgi:hypothetical protein
MNINLYLKTLILTILLILNVSCSDSKPDKLVSSFSNDLNGSTFATGRASQINVYANYDDGTSENITNTLLWSSSDESIATVSNGLVQTYTTVGTVDIKYETLEQDSADAPFYEYVIHADIRELTLKTITLSKTNVSLSIGASVAITASGTFEDNTTSIISTQDITQDCNWSSADINISSVDTGTIKGIGEGNTTVAASDSNISAFVAVEVTKTNYTSVSIYSAKDKFNVEQTIILEARAITDKGNTIILDNSNVTWSSDSSNVTMIQNIATAKTKGSAIVTVVLNEDTSLKSTKTLTVEKDKYVRLFKADVEVVFPYVSSETNTTLATTLGVFTLRAVGEDITIRTLYIQDFNGNVISSGFTIFDGLASGDIISADQNRTYTLKQSGFENDLVYFFDINASSSFKQTYEVVN